MKNFIQFQILIVVFSFSKITSQTKNPITDYKFYIENEQVISENKLEAHASFSSFSSEKEALNNQPQFFKLLDGICKFN